MTMGKCKVCPYVLICVPRLSSDVFRCVLYKRVCPSARNFFWKTAEKRSKQPKNIAVAYRTTETNIYFKGENSKISRQTIMLWEAMEWRSSSVRLARLLTDVQSNKQNIEVTTNYRKSGKRLEARALCFRVWREVFVLFQCHCQLVLRFKSMRLSFRTNDANDRNRKIESLSTGGQIFSTSYVAVCP